MGLTTQQRDFVMEKRHMVAEIVNKMRISNNYRDDAISDGTLALMQCVMVKGQGEEFNNSVETYIIDAIKHYPKRRSTKIIIDITVK